LPSHRKDIAAAETGIGETSRRRAWVCGTASATRCQENERKNGRKQTKIFHRAILLVGDTSSNRPTVTPNQSAQRLCATKKLAQRKSGMHVIDLQPSFSQKLRAEREVL
jgi:hypothetical protein